MPESANHGAGSGVDSGAARDHYRRGNRFYEEKLWERALDEWHQATKIWRPAKSSLRRKLSWFSNLRAVLALSATLCLVYFLLYTLYPRDPFDLAMSAGGSQDNRSWWEQFLDSGRPGSESNHKMGVREWWERFQRRFNQDEKKNLATGDGLRPSIEKRWADLLRRYGRWGPLTAGDLDYSVIAGNGLSGLDEFDQAIAVIKEGISKTREPDRLGELYQGLANAYYFRGYELQQDGLAKYEMESIALSAKAYERSLLYQPRLLALGNLGWVYYLLGQYDEAEDSSLEALSHDANLFYVKLNLGLIYLVQNRFDEAFRSYRQVAANHPEAEIYLGGINDLKEAIRDSPGRHAFAHLMIGYLELQKGAPIEARRHLELFLASGEMAPRWRNLGQRWLRNPASATEM